MPGSAAPGQEILALKKYVPEERIVVDKASGKDLNRPGYTAYAMKVLGLKRTTFYRMATEYKRQIMSDKVES